MGNATVSFFGDMASRYIILSYSFGSVVRWFDRQFRLLLLLKELRVQVSPFPNTILQLCCLWLFVYAIYLCFALTFRLSGLPVQWKLTSFSLKRTGTVLSRYLTSTCLRLLRLLYFCSSSTKLSLLQIICLGMEYIGKSLGCHSGISIKIIFPWVLPDYVVLIN